MTKKMYCEVCSEAFHAQRSTAKYCSESCKQSAKYSRENDLLVNKPLEKFTLMGYELSKFIKKHRDGDYDNDMFLSLIPELSLIRHELNRLEAYIATIESEQASTWYQCNDCGQRTFGKVAKCDFCGKSDFKVIKV